MPPFFRYSTKQKLWRKSKLYFCTMEMSFPDFGGSSTKLQKNRH